MATKVFISWSGDLSNKLAEAVREWLPGVLQFVKPYFTPNDIEKGTRWGSDIVGELESSDIGIICVTKENVNEPWILFESGALSKNFDKSRVCVVLFGLDSSDLKGPLSIFQHTKIEKNDFKKLVKSINQASGDAKLEDPVLNNVFDMWWPNLESKVSRILADSSNQKRTKHRSERDMLEEVLELTRLNSRRKDRFPEIPQGLITEIVEQISELEFIMDRGDFELARKMIRRLDKPISYICRHSGYPDLFDKRMMMKKHMLRHHQEEGGEKE